MVRPCTSTATNAAAEVIEILSIRMTVSLTLQRTISRISDEIFPKATKEGLDRVIKTYTHELDTAKGAVYSAFLRVIYAQEDAYSKCEL